MNRSDASNRRTSDTIRSEIDQTRERMDHTIDALSERLKGRHLVDEILGYFRSNGNSRHLREKITDSAGTAMHAVVDAVKAHPLPVLMMAAGVAWLAYEKKERERTPPLGRSDEWPESPMIDPQTSEPSALGGSPYGEAETGGGVGDRLRDKAASMREGVEHASSEMSSRAREGLAHLRGRAGEGISHLRERAGEGLAHLRVRAGETRERVQVRTRELARRTRDNIAETVEEHPVESGMSIFAMGLIAGLMTPTPRPLRDTVAPASRKLRERVQEAGADLAERGRRVAEAATSAVKSEAEKQGLTPEAISAKAREVAGSTSSQDEDPGQGSRRESNTAAAASASTGGMVAPAGPAPWVPGPASGATPSSAEDRPTMPRPDSPA